MSCNNTNNTCSSCNYAYSSCTNKCEKCGCENSFLTNSLTTENCQDLSPCSEVLNAQCVVYTGLNITCDTDVIVTTNDTVDEALVSITNYFCNNSSDPVVPVDIIQIPQLNIQSFGTGKNLTASILPGTESNTYLNYNPKIFLFVKKNGKSKIVRDINDDKIAKYYYGGWHHTTHMQGINFPNSNFYGGTTLCDTHSEFPLTVTEPYNRQLLTGFNPEEFYGFRDNLNSAPAPLNLTVLWSERDKFYVRGRKHNEFCKSVYFRFAIGIENPDVNSKFPIIFGPLTASIQCKIACSRDNMGVLRVSYVFNHDPTNIKHFNHI
jgi:hypothetical protein